jgi:hypothetical protein
LGNRIPERICGPKQKVVTGKLKILYKCKLHNFCSSLESDEFLNHERRKGTKILLKNIVLKGNLSEMEQCTTSLVSSLWEGFKVVVRLNILQ